MAKRDEVIAKVNEFNAATSSLDFSYFKVSNNLGLHWRTQSGAEYSDKIQKQLSEIDYTFTVLKDLAKSLKAISATVDFSEISEEVK